MPVPDPIDIREFRELLTRTKLKRTTASLSVWFSKRNIALLTDRLDIAISAGADEHIQKLIRRCFE